MTTMTNELKIELCLSGYRNVGSDHESGEYWRDDKRAELPLLGRLVLEKPSVLDGEELSRFIRVEARRLPDGDVILYYPKGWVRLTSDPKRIEDHNARSRIWGHRYERRLLDALIRLERCGRPPGLVYSWLGGTCGLHELATTAVSRSYAGGKTKTGPEEVESLREYLEEVAEKDWSGASIAAEARELAVPGSIMELVREEVPGR